MIEMLSLPNGEIHVWQASVNPEALREAELLRALSSQEQARADRFRFRKDHDLFIIGRSMIRALLSGYLGCLPQEIRFDYSPYGKPELPTDLKTDLEFNLSHSHELVLFAVTRGRKIGIDVEYMRANATDGAVARQVFSAQEFAVFLALPSHLQQRAFFNGWTRKEAFIKAKGEGLSMPLNQFDISLDPRETPKFLSIRPDATEIKRWSLRDLELPDGYVGAIAVESQDRRLKRFRWPGFHEGLHQT